MSTKQVTPSWILNAFKKLGIKEIKGSKHNPTILGWLVILKAWWKDDETPWCGTFVAICLKEVGLAIIKNWFRAKDWKDYGFAVIPCLGAILVFGREGGGHVGFYMGEGMRLIKGKLVLCYLVRGGNQGDAVSDTWIEASRLIASRWPTGVEVTTKPVIITNGTGTVSTNEK